MIGPKLKPGPKTHSRLEIMKQWGITLKQAKWASENIWQLDACKDDSARRILLGIGEKFEVKL